jgi:hypothetical protein
MALEHQRQMIVTPATSRLHSLLVWGFVRWTDRTHLGGRLWAWRVPQIAAIVVAVSAIGLAIAERRARARQATEWAAVPARRRGAGIRRERHPGRERARRALQQD